MENGENKPPNPLLPIRKFNTKLAMRVVKTGGLMFLGLFAAYLVFDWAMSAAVHSRHEVMVPDLKGKSLSEALNIVSSANLGIRKAADDYNQKVPAGTVIFQVPQPGMMVREGKIIRITVSKGGEIIFVPDLLGKQVRSAEVAIRSAGLALGEESSKNSVVYEKGLVVAQDPPSGGIEDKDALVNLVISAGLPAKGIKLMPKFLGRNASEAKAWADQNQIQLAIEDQGGGGAPDAIVVAQSPDPDDDLGQSASAKISVSGPGGAGGAVSKLFHYEIPQGGGQRAVRLVVSDGLGEREIFKESRQPGTKIEQPVSVKGSAKIKIFINNVMVEERQFN